MRVALVLGFLLTLATPLTARADGTLLEQADRAIDDLDFDQAVKLYRAALKQPGDRAARAHAYRGLGLALAFLGDAAKAKENFVTLLVIDPQAKVNASLGPKIAKPFEDAKRSLRGKKVKLPAVKVERDERSRQVTAEIDDPMDPIVQVELHVVANGKEQSVTATLPKPAAVDVEPWVGVKAWAAGVDDGDGVIVQSGEPAKLLDFPATARPPAAVESAVAEANKQKIPSEQEAIARRDEEPTESGPEVASTSGSSRWPLYVGGAAVAIAGGAAAAYFLSAPPALHLPAADRTGRLP